MAPASSNASAWVSPSPRAAPDTKMTLSVRLNSGSRFVVPRKLAEAVSFCIFSVSWGGGAGGLRPGVLGSLPRGGSSNVKAFLNAWLVDKDRDMGGTYTLTFLKAKGSRRAMAVIFKKKIAKTPVDVASADLQWAQLLQSRTIEPKANGRWGGRNKVDSS